MTAGPGSPLRPRPGFAVVVAAWQAAGTVGEAVASALGQTEPPAEVLVCDDGSPDQVAGALAPFGDRVRLLRIEHAGASAARNAAVRAAGQEFVVLLDADDRWEPERLARLGDLAVREPELDVLTTDAWFVVDGVRTGRFHTREHPFPTADQDVEILRRNFVFGHAAVRRSRWLAVGGMDPGLRQAEDWDLWVRLVLSGSRVGCVPEPLADYRIHGASLSAARAASLLARVVVLSRAEATDLRPDQRAALARAKGDYLRRGRRAAAEAALADAAPGRRRACARLAGTPGLPLRARLLAAGAIAAPELAGRRLRTGRELTGRLPSDRDASTA